MENAKHTAPVPIKSYTKKELIYMYGISYSQLRKWIELCLEDLEEVGYEKYNRYLTPRQIEVFFKHVGEP